MCIARRDLFRLQAGAGTTACLASVNYVHASKPSDPLRDSYLAPTLIASGDEPNVVIYREFGARLEIYTGYQ